MKPIINVVEHWLINGVDARGLWKRYVLGLSIIVALLISSHSASLWSVSVAENDAQVINDSGRQRMLSQRILYFANITMNDETSVPEGFESAIDLFKSTHNALTASKSLSDEMRVLYYDNGGKNSLDSMVRQYVADARTIASSDHTSREKEVALERMAAVGPGVLLIKLNAAVTLYEEDARKRLERIAAWQNYSLLLALITIVVEALVIFFPAHVAARRALDRLERQKQALEAARRAEELKSREIEAMRSAAEHEALHDPLTGLANRRYLEREVKRLSREADAQQHRVAVFHIDLDRFKQINDTMGHAAGDFVLKYVATTLKSVAREEDFIARVGGDEFVILIRSKGERRSLEAIASRVIERLRQPVQFEGELCRFGASIGIDIGIAEASCDDIVVTDLLTNADIALYRAKEMGRGRFCFFSEELRTEMQIARSLSDELSIALAKNEFFPVYQPQICAETGELHGVEALARWRHPTRGVLTPAAFLPIAEQLGVTADIDERMFEAALEDLSKWDAIGLRVPRLAVNVSARRLRDFRLADHLSRLAIPPDRISFEIVETVLADAIDDHMRMGLDRISELGIAIEVDDFGTGHASLTSIISLAPSRLKIARELVSPLPNSEAHQKLARSIVEISKSLGVDVIAEGVETAEQDRFLTGIGCDVLQGYRFAKPMTAEALISKVSRDGSWRPTAPDALTA